MRFIGHRGASHSLPENTLRSIRGAMYAGMGFEVDLQLLVDGTVIVLHDDTLERTAVDSADCGPLLCRPVAELTWAEVQCTRVGDQSHAELVPLFAQVLDELKLASAFNDSAHGFAELKSEQSHHGILLSLPSPISAGDRVAPSEAQPRPVPQARLLTHSLSRQQRRSSARPILRPLS
jgi:glycerophosphoryl diester phosphodiesterase